MMKTTQHADRVDVNGAPDTTAHGSCLLKAVTNCAGFKVGAKEYRAPKTPKEGRRMYEQIVKVLSQGRTVTLMRGIVTIPLQH